MGGGLRVGGARVTSRRKLLETIFVGSTSGSQEEDLVGSPPPTPQATHAYGHKYTNKYALQRKSIHGK